MEVSIIVIAYNEALYIQKCIMGILNQSVSDFELLIIDDYSTDGTARAIREICDARIRYIKNLRNSGVSKSRNIGIRQAKGKYIFFIDADCMPTRYWLEEGLRILRGNKYVAVEGKTFYAKARTTISDRVVEWLEGGHYGGCNMAYTKEILDKVGGFNLRYDCFEDKDIAFRILKYGQITFSEDMIAIHQQKKFTINKLFQDAKRAENAVRFIKEYRNHRDIDILYRKIMYPKKLLILLFPFLLIPYHSFRSWQDVKLVPFIYLAAIYVRVIIWKEAIKEKILLF